MINNYKYPVYYPQPQLLRDQYTQATKNIQLNLPLPGYSQKIRFVDKPDRFLNIHRKQRQIDYLKSMIQNKVNMEQMHYQARLQQMRRQNQYNRQRLQLLLEQQPTNLFRVPDKITEQAKMLSQNLENITMKKLHAQKQRYLMDSVDKLRMQNSSRVSKSVNLGRQDELSHDSQQQEQQNKQRKKDLQYIYKKNGAINKANHFGTEPILKKEQKKIQQKLQQKRQQYEWVQKVKKVMKQKKFLINDNQSVDSSKPSENSEQKEQKQKQKQKLKAKQKQASVRNSMRNSPVNSRNNNRLSSQKRELSARQQKQSDYHYSQNHKQRTPRTPVKIEYKQPQSIRQKTSLNNQIKNKGSQLQVIKQRASDRTISRQEQISNISQFSRYAQKNNIFQRKKQLQKQNAKKRYENIFQRNDQDQPQDQNYPVNKGKASQSHKKNKELPHQQQILNNYRQLKNTGQKIPRTPINQIKNDYKKPQSVRQRAPSDRTVSREEQISNISQFSRYAQKNNIFQRKKQLQKQNAKKRFENIYQRDDQDEPVVPITNQRAKRGNWKI